MKKKSIIVFLFLLVLILLGLILNSKFNYYQKIISVINKTSIGKTKSLVSSNYDSVAFTTPNPPYIVIVHGEIPQDHSKVELEEIFYTNIKYGSSSRDRDSKFTIVFKKNNEPYYWHNFAGFNCAKGYGDICESDPNFGHFAMVLTNIPETPDEIEFQYLGTPFYTIAKPDQPMPIIQITKQTYDGDSINIEWTTNDHDRLRYMAFASNNGFINNLSDNAGNKTEVLFGDGTASSQDSIPYLTNHSLHFNRKGLMEGNIQLVIYSTDGFNTVSALSDIFPTDPIPACAKIIQPKNFMFYSRLYVKFKANEWCNNRDESRYSWYSNVDGLISEHNDSYSQRLTPGFHKITLVVTGPNGMQATDSVYIFVYPNPNYPDSTPTPKKPKIIIEPQ